MDSTEAWERRKRFVSALSSRRRPSNKCSVSIYGEPNWLASYRAKKMTRRAFSVYRSNMFPLKSCPPKASPFNANGNFRPVPSSQSHWPGKTTRLGGYKFHTILYRSSHCHDSPFWGKPFVLCLPLKLPLQTLPPLFHGPTVRPDHNAWQEA